MKRGLGSWLLIGAAGLLCAACSNQAVVLGNVASTMVAVGLFVTTLNLRRDG